LGEDVKTAIATVSVSGDLPEKLAAISTAGFDGIEIFEQDFIAHDEGPKDVGRMVRDHGLEIMLFQPFRDFEGLPDPERSRAFDRAERKFDVMGELGTDLMLICSSVHPKSLGGIDRAADDLAELGERAARRGLRLGYEALAWGRHVNDHRDAWEIVRRADHPAIGIILDSFHTLGRKLDPGSIRAIPGDKIFFVQLADAPLIEMDLLYWSRHFRNMPGEGDLDVVGFMQAVAATGYDGPLSLEIFNDQFRGGSPHAIARDGLRSLLALMDDVTREHPAPALSVAPMPPRTQVEGVEFVEFAADEVESERLGKLLASMGFALAGQHINKDVTLWCQGDINVVINTEREGFAHTTYLAQGTSVCDIGLRVADAAATAERAQALGVKLFQQPLGQGELALPAIQSVGRGVMHFVDETSGLTNVWGVEFTPIDRSGPDAGLSHIDHIAQTMDYEEMLTWSLFYTSLFDVSKKPVVDVIDPGGVVRSQVIESEDARFRITLNGADTSRTLAGRFVADRVGSAVQHVAFVAEDIVHSAARMRDLGFASLPMPGNYYDDIAARFGLEETQVDRLRAGNILYDEDDEGAFYQLYSQPYGPGFFFEIIQRVGGYQGYGAANAPYRIAALKRLLGEGQKI
jgi:4-hydroxyphenylpyruvate dioxygenase